MARHRSNLTPQRINVGSDWAIELIGAIIRQAICDYQNLAYAEKRLLNAVEHYDIRRWGNEVTAGRDARHFIFTKRLEAFFRYFRLDINPYWLRRRAKERA